MMMDLKTSRYMTGIGNPQDTMDDLIGYAILAKELSDGE